MQYMGYIIFHNISKATKERDRWVLKRRKDEIVPLSRSAFLFVGNSGTFRKDPKKWIGKHDEIFAIYTTDISAALEWIASTIPIPGFPTSMPPVQLRRSVIARSQTIPEEILRQTGTTHGPGDKWDFPSASWPGYCLSSFLPPWIESRS